MINISNIINVSVSASPSGLAPYSVNNLLCITDEVPDVSLAGAAYAAYVSPIDVGVQWGTDSGVYAAAVAVFSQNPNILSGGGVFLVAPILTSPSTETFVSAIVRLAGLVYFGGVSYAMTVSDADLLTAATTCQSLRKLLFIAKSATSALDSPSGILFEIQDQSLNQARGILYTLSGSLEACKWSYASRGMSTDFSGSNTTSTMQLKQLAGVPSDSGLTQTIYNNAATVGADLYANIAGRPSAISNGANSFFDDVYNLNWLVGAIQVAGFNYLATTSTKVTQTESGMSGLKGAYTQVCQQAVANLFLAPGTWTSSNTFGNPADFRRSIETFGYYVYSQPVALQSSADRALRKAPLVQVAVKYAGSIQTSDVVIFFNV